MFLLRPAPQDSQRRRGWLAPILALVLFVVLGLIALVLDRLWLDMATSEAQSVAEASAVAAGRELASDDALRLPDPGPEGKIRLAKIAAENVAALNRVAGQAFTLNADQGDVIFGSNLTVEDTDESRFVESIHEVRSVRVLAQRTRARRNPVALFFGGLTKVPAGDVAAMAEATLDNRIVGFQVIGDARIPALPLAILARAPTGSPCLTWNDQIERRRGTDRFRYDPVSRSVVPGQDGIPEIVLTPAMNGSKPVESNTRLFCVHQQRDLSVCDDQIRLGWSKEHLAHRDGQVLLTAGPEQFPSSRNISSGAMQALKEIVGECRAVMLFQEEWTEGNEGWGRIQGAGFVAGRVMAVNEQGGQNPQIVFQPAVLATRSAMLLSDLNSTGSTTTTGDAKTGGPDRSDSNGDVLNGVVHPNKYLYQLKLTQ